MKTTLLNNQLSHTYYDIQLIDSMFVIKEFLYSRQDVCYSHQILLNHCSLNPEHKEVQVKKWQTITDGIKLISRALLRN